MKVYKFGGASIASPQHTKKLLPIIESAEKPLIIIFSALGKTTNLLESILTSAKENPEHSDSLIDQFENIHLEYAQSLLTEVNFKKCQEQLSLYFSELGWALDDMGIQRDDYIYDQVVCIGELCSSTIISHYLKQEGNKNVLVDARDIIRTNDDYRMAVVQEQITKQNVINKILPLSKDYDIIITQGFIGATDENNSTTLGREGSDYTAALLGAYTNAESVTIWKDVPGFLNADPRKYENTVRIPELSFHEVIELTYYGAQVIHPKTIKPLFLSKIPLHVKCFEDQNLPGSVIHAVENHINYPPLIVHKGDQLLIDIRTKDFSFITRRHLADIYEICEQLRVKINMMQNAATSLQICIDAQHFAIPELIATLKEKFILLRNENMEILTVRHYTPESLTPLLNKKEIIVEQKTRSTYQCIYRS